MRLSGNLGDIEVDEHDIWALLSLSCTHPRSEEGAWRRAVDAIGGEPAGRLLTMMRARSLASSRLSAMSLGSEAVADAVRTLGPDVSTISEMREKLAANLGWLDDLGRDLGIAIFTFKGLGAMRLYERPDLRDFGDIDLYVPTAAEGVRLANALRHDHGYELNRNELPWIKRDPRADLIYGQYNLHPAGPGPRLPVDVHFGDYSVRHCARLGLHEVVPSAPPGLHHLPAPLNLAACINNSAGDYVVTAKDMNDVLAALRSPGFDVDAFVGCLEQAGLVPFLSQILHRLELVADLTDADRAVLSRLPRRRSLEPTPPWAGFHWRRRCWGTVVHATRWGWERGGSLQAVRAGISAYHYYRTPLTLRGAEPGKRPDRVGALAMSTCLRLVPLEIATELVGGPDRLPAASSECSSVTTVIDPRVPYTRFDTPYGTFVEVAGEVFVGTLRYRVAPELVATALRARVAP